MVKSRYVPERDYAANGWKPFGKPVDDMCGRCERYYKNLHTDGVIENEFPPHCHKHVLEGFKDITVDDFEDPTDYEEAVVVSDPVAWAFREFENADSESGRWEPRWYQQEMLSCTSQLKLMRAGRRTGKTEFMVIGALHHIYVHSYHTVLIIAPYERQVTRFFDEMKKFMHSSAAMMNSVVRETKAPNRIEFANGSKVLGFSAGSKTAARSDKIRGQDANLIIIDEVDYIGDDDMDAIMAILASHPDCGLWLASTPTGEHKKFYAFSTNKDSAFKEFHYISAESPNWTKAVEGMYRATYSRAAYEHEFYAEFGQQEAGVYRNELVDASLQDYDMNVQTPQVGGMYCLGIDWNKNAGTHMVILEYHPGMGFKMLKKIIIPKSEFMQTKAVETIIELDGYWNFKGIWVDRGYGTVQVEMLKKYGMNTPNSTLHERVWDIAMNEMIEVRDPLSGAILRKNTKPFLVETLAKQLEDGQIILPESEDTSITTSDGNMGLAQQMRNYKVERFSNLGLPTYSQGQDHTLVALQLAVSGFILEFGDLRHVQYLNRVVIGGNFGEPDDAITEKERMDHRAALDATRSAIPRDVDRDKPLFGYSNMGSVYNQHRRKGMTEKPVSDKKLANYLSRQNLGYRGRKKF